MTGHERDGALADEGAAMRLKRLRLRCWRRGTKEMDLILGPFADAVAEGRAACDLDALEALMAENDQDLYLWVSGAAPAPERHMPMIAALRDFHGIAPRG
ncbi:succinate dehydrogenase assembly factor 2 [Oceanicella actignis]|uniref:FAD assembly factor SdhE n=1 Tax=Oceanicella actignis TaxID=1189325 RepID=A0A1M7TXF1_9RHOB|nr:succinate dehydrogenase assembly factor 2 [Oceanicella actignis]TYO89614.1 antitoxin CptB [Oceanicella actignis]SET80368.1 antitoxin CptB [Oceanicella actignis]SHN75429.1 antitoxin CptB [Oceanicella actignis]